MSQLVLLLDIDGVLVNPGGYRKAAHATLNWFTKRMGLETISYDERTLSQFEAHNISSEFDIVPLCLVEIFDRIQAQYPELNISGDLYQACDQLCGLNPECPPVDFSQTAKRVGRVLKPGCFPSKAALQANQTGMMNMPFRHLPSHPLLDKILSHTRNINLSPVTQIFQQNVLGSKLYKSVYRLPAKIKTISLLKAFDQPMLDRELAKKLMKDWVLNKIHLVAYTGRPSALSDVNEPLLSYSPEADLALKTVDLGGIPLVGFGHTYRLAKLTNGKPDQLGKPSLISALGAIGAAVTKDSIEALLAAERWINRGENNFFRQLPPMDIHIFEDTAASIPSTKQAASMLNDIGVPTSFHAWGIARTETKMDALKSAGAEIWDDINAGIRAVFDTR
ncbi:MAG: hypothetical protein JW908_05855 [Anaerolineales bacterium]|nr:hypothetical protein [Anaerolineales bacterium]